MAKARVRTVWFAVGVLSMVLPVETAAAAPVAITVDTLSDGADPDPSDGICDDGAGDCSLRAAIETANDLAASEGTTISFAIGSGPVTIEPSAQLPPIDSPYVTVDGTTQPGYLPDETPIVEVSGAVAGAGTGLRLTSGGAIVRGLVVNRWDTGVEMAGGIAGQPNVVNGNYIGTDVTGALDRGNHVGVLLSAPFNQLGGQFGWAAAGPCTGGCNVISGNAINVHMVADGSAVGGNVIGTDVTGTSAVESDHLGPGIGVLIEPAAALFGANVGGGAPQSRNVISGHDAAGIEIGSTATDVAIEGNFIGPDVTGTAAIGNEVGIDATHGGDFRIGGAPLSGGSCQGSCNLISGNDSGVEFGGQGDFEIEGNFIGTDVNGTVALGAQAYGIHLLSGLNPFTEIHGNLVSGNDSPLYMETDLAPGFLYGGLYGTDTTGTQVIGNGGPVHVRGQVLFEGGTVVAGSAGVGLELMGDTYPPSVERSIFIGTDVTGTIALPNLGGGIDVVGGAHIEDAVIANNQAFGIRASAITGTLHLTDGNTVGHNAGPGLMVEPSPSGAVVVDNTSFVDNAGLGIDWHGDGVTPSDDPDLDGVPNAPEIVDVTSTSPVTTRFMASFVPHTDSSGFRVDVYRSTSCDPSGSGEGDEWLGQSSVSGSTGGAPVPFDFELNVSVNDGDVITMTATQSSSTTRTSEFSECFVIGPSDTDAPVITITAPSDGAEFTIGQVVDADFSCNDTGSGVATCIGTVPDGSQIDTSAAGSYPFDVDATDNAGNPAATTHTYEVLAGNVEETVPSGGGTVTTDPGGLGATDEVPVQTIVETSDGGAVSVEPGPPTGGATGYDFLGEELSIVAPDATDPSQPLTLTFQIDPSTGADPATLVVFRDGVPVPLCTGPVGPTANYPCMTAPSLNALGDVEVVVYTMQASAWNFGVREPYTVQGFFQPVDNRPTLNVLKAGSAVPAKFSLDAGGRLDIFARGFPRSAVIDCGANPDTDPVEETTTTGASQLRYVDGVYEYAWKTEKAWKGTCRQLVLRFDDGSYLRANFKLK